MTKKFYYKYGHGLDDTLAFGPYVSVAAAQKAALKSSDDMGDDPEFEIVMVVSRTAVPVLAWEEVE